MLETLDWTVAILFMPIITVAGGIGSIYAFFLSKRRRTYIIAAICGGSFGLFLGTIPGLIGALVATWLVFAFGPGFHRKVCASLGLVFGIALQLSGSFWKSHETGMIADAQYFIARCMICSAFAATGAAFWRFYAYLRNSYHSKIGSKQ
jgi:hypothetical protein